MTLSMTRPQKHPDSGYYWFRKRVPEDLRDLIGKREERFSLGTRDPSEAKRLHALKLAEVEERWANLRAGQRPLSPDDVARLASEIGDQFRRRLEADPYQPLRWDVEIGARLWTASDTHDFYTDITQALSPPDQKRLDQQNICYGLVDEHVFGRGVGALLNSQDPPGRNDPRRPTRAHAAAELAVALFLFPFGLPLCANVSRVPRPR
jgi:hypothetical protein